jgi:hypothetical protein
MRSTHFIFPLLLVCGQAWCQAPAPATASTNTPPPISPREVVDTRTENIHVEDAAARIDELRVGGETKRISVQPKGGMPAYQVAPKTGERTWKVLGF